MTKTKSCNTHPSALETLRLRLGEAEQAWRSIRHGEVGALIAGPKSERAFRLKRPDGLYYHLIEQMQEGACILNPQGTILFANLYLMHLLDAKLDQMMGSTWSHWARAEDQSRFRRLLQQGLKGSVTSEIELVSANGEPRPVQLSLSLLQTEEGQKIAALVIDLRGRKQEEETWRRAQNESEQRVIERTSELGAVNEELRKEIDERKRVEARLDYHANLLANVHDAILATDHRLNLSAWNRAAEQIYGWKAEEVLGRPVDEVIRSEFTAAERQRALQTLAETGHYHAEVVQYNREGAQLYIEGDTVALRDQAGRITGYVSAFRNITERKRAEEKLRGSERRFRLLIESIPHHIWSFRPNGMVGYWNQQLADYTGLSAEELRQGGWSALHPADVDHIRANRQKAFANGTPYEIEQRIRGRDGDYRRFLCRAVPLRDEKGQTVEWLRTDTDIEERKRAEKALQESEELFSAVFEHSSSAIALTDLVGRFVKANRAFQELFGYSEAELRAMADQDIVYPDDLERSMTLTTELLNGSRSEYQLESRRRCKDGRMIWVRVSASAIPAADGKPRFVMKVVEDITDHVEVQQLLEQRVEERTREIERRRQVAEGLHEFLRSLNEKRPLNEVLQHVVAQACHLLNTDSCAIFEIQPGGEFLWVRASRGLPPELSAGARVPMAQGPVSRAILERVPVMIRDWGREVTVNWLAIDPRWREAVIRLSRQIRAVFAIPLLVKDETYGALALYYPEPRAMTVGEFQLGVSVAAQAALAIETARLYEQERGIATLEERQRLARELHDSVSQALYGIQLEAHSAHEWLEHDPQRAAQRLDSVLSLTDEALAEMRAVIFELRPESLGAEGLVGALDKYAADLRTQRGLQVQTVFGEEPAVSGDVKQALYRIAREALQNTVRHAHATRVELQLHRSPRGLVMQISDNGIGFNTSQSSPGHLGLHTMSERAAQLDGSFEIESTPSIGTFIRVEIPL